jgi:pyruvate,water dikinase
MAFCIPFKNITSKDIQLVGGKNASLGEMLHSLTPLGVKIPDGFAISTLGYWQFLKENNLTERLTSELQKLDTLNLRNLSVVGKNCRELIKSSKIPTIIEKEVIQEFEKLKSVNLISVAVRSSATAEDLPTASFAGQHDSFLNVKGTAELIDSILACYVSLYNDRAIKYRLDNGFEHSKVALSIGIQQMVRSDIGSAGVAFTIDPETGFKNVIYITSSWGLGETIVQGAVNPDEFYLFKPAIGIQKKSIIQRKLGDKENKIIYSENGQTALVNIRTLPAERSIFSLTDSDVEKLGDWCKKIENHYNVPMDIEWAKDGNSGNLFIVQARPETVHTQKEKITLKEYSLHTKAKPICSGKAVGRAISSGKVCVIHSLADAKKVQKGDIIVAEATNPDWNALLRKAICIVTNKGGRTSHASIVARELGIHAVVGVNDATEKLKDGQTITVSCIEGDEGRIYDGKLEWEEHEISLENIPEIRTKALFILADPDKAFHLSFYPNDGVGLLRMEFIISNSIKIHPMALVKFDQIKNSEEKKEIELLTKNYTDKKKYFIEKLSESIAMVAAAFYPKEVIVRLSDFKTNEYAQLLGGAAFEPKEENPMLGFRGASRYYNDLYKEGFGLECEAIRTIRDDLGLTNVKIMVPFCRTVEEGKKVLDVMETFGLIRGKNSLQIYVMAEIPSNVILAEKFAEIFDGFSIGSNDLTQLTLGIDRDSSLISNLFDENNEAVKRMLSSVIQTAKNSKIQIGLCGQAPSDYPSFAQFLVEEGIDSISFTPDALFQGIQNIHLAELKSTIFH